MKTFRQTVLPVAAGLLFGLSAFWMFANWLRSLIFRMRAVYTTEYSVSLINVLLASSANLFYVGTSPFDAIGTLLIPLWLKLCAPDDLKPYEDMVGQMFTPEQLEEKRLELGLAKRKKAAV